MTDVTENQSSEPITDYKMGSDNIRPFGLDIHNPVFVVSAGVIGLFVILALLFQETSATFFGWLRPFLTSQFDWFLVISVDIMLLFCLVLIFLPVGSVRIGGKDAKPDYSYPGWIAMLFAAGIGIGLLFFGVLEPVYYTYAEGGAATGLCRIRGGEDRFQLQFTAIAHQGHGRVCGGLRNQVLHALRRVCGTVVDSGHDVAGLDTGPCRR